MSELAALADYPETGGPATASGQVRVFPHADPVPRNALLAYKTAAYDVRSIARRFGPWINYRSARLGDIRDHWERCRLQWLIREVDSDQDPAGCLQERLEQFARTYPALRGSAWVSALEGAVRGVSVCLALGVVERRGSSDVALRALVGRLLRDCELLIDLTRSSGSSGNNHALGESVAKAVFAWVLGRPRPMLLRRLAEGANEFLAQTHADGSGREAASRYWEFNYQWGVLLTALYAIAETTPPESFRGRLEAARSVLRAPTGVRAVPGLVLGDTDDATVWSRYWPNRSFPARHAPSPISAGAPWIRRLDVGLIIAQPDGRGRITIALRAGAFGFPATAPHSHADQLSLYVAIDGRPVIVDPGIDRYFGYAARREALRVESAHATFRIRGQAHAAPAGRFLWRHTCAGTIARVGPVSEGLVGCAELPGLTLLRREVGWDQQRAVLRIRDSGSCQANQLVDWAWPVSDEVDILRSGPSEWELRWPRGSAVLALRDSGVPISAEVGELPYCRGYADVREGHVLRVTLRGNVVANWELSVIASEETMMAVDQGE
jgi:hypothetical protein